MLIQDSCGAHFSLHISYFYFSTFPPISFTLLDQVELFRILLQRDQKKKRISNADFINKSSS